MANLSEQKILAYVNHESDYQDVVEYAAYVAKCFDKDLCLFNVAKSKTEKAQKSSGLYVIKEKMEERFPKIRTSVLVITGSLESSMEMLADAYDAVLMVVNRQYYGDVVNGFRESGFPFLFVNGVGSAEERFEQVYLPIDFRRESKEASIWASYFGRFCNSSVSVFGANEKYSEEKKKVHSNISSVRQLFGQFSFPVRYAIGKTSSWGIQKESLIAAKELNNSLFIMVGSHYNSPFDYLIGTPEKRILRRSADVPVLCINPRKDMYLLCD
ncbi:hypothetical protein EYV94_23475 [Puteibacter caeruleilacunae]|nr:hypothetical protein EYV94_23475 [Puteibacter caeruleilacunae]